MSDGSKLGILLFSTIAVLIGVAIGHLLYLFHLSYYGRLDEINQILP